MHDVTAIFLCCASFFGVTALTADRFLAIHLHLRYQELVTHRRVVAVVTSIWAISAILSQLIWLWNQKVFSTAIGIIPPSVCLILTASFFAARYIYSRTTPHKSNSSPASTKSVAQNGEVMTNSARQIKSAVGTFYVYLVFLVCSLPYISISAACALTGESILINTLWDYTETLVCLNSSLNLVYCWKMRHIRRPSWTCCEICFQAK